MQRVRGALEDIPGIRQMRIEFDRREVAIRYDPDSTDVIRFLSAIEATGGYVGGLRFGPIRSTSDFTDLLDMPEDSLVVSDTAFAHSAFTILKPEQFERNLSILQKLSPDDDLNLSPEKYVAVYVSLWTSIPDVIPYDWSENALLQLSGQDQFLTPNRWIPMAHHIEDDGSGSEIGMLLFPRSESMESLHNSELILGQLIPSVNNRVHLHTN